MDGVLFISDIHAHNWKSNSKIVDGKNSRLLTALNCIEQAKQKAVELDVKTICVGGDLFHVRGQIKPSVFTSVFQKLKEIADSGISIVIVAGNHDQENFVGGATSIDALSEITGNGGARVFVATEPAKIDIKAGLSVGCIPYIHDKEKWREALSDMLDSDPSFILCHQGIDDFKGESGTPDTGITVDCLRGETPIFSGHYHNPMSKHNVVSIGSPYHQNFGDEKLDMGCWIWSHKTKAEFIKLNYPKFMTIGDKIKDWTICDGNIIRIKSKSAAKAKLAISRAIDAGAIEATAVIEKEFVTAHSKTIELSTPDKMFFEYLEIQEDMSEEIKKDLKFMFEKVCLRK